WLPYVALAFATDEHFHAALLGFCQPLLDPVSRTAVNYGTHVGVLVQWVADFERLHARDQVFHEIFVFFAMHVNPLHRNARLSGVGKAAPRDPTRGVTNVGVVVDDDSRVAAEFQRDHLASGAFTQIPAHRRTAREA